MSWERSRRELPRKRQERPVRLLAEREGVHNNRFLCSASWYLRPRYPDASGKNGAREQRANIRSVLRTPPWVFCFDIDRDSRVRESIPFVENTRRNAGHPYHRAATRGEPILHSVTKLIVRAS